MFYVASIFIIVSTVAWNDPLLPVQGSYLRALELLNIPHAKAMVDMVVLVAVASCLNSAIYISSSMVFSLSKRGDAPKMLGKTSRQGVPLMAVLARTAIGLITTALNFFAPTDVFNFLLAPSGAIALLVYLVIAVCQLRMRYRLERSHQPIKLKTWMFPVLTWLVIAFIIGALTTMVVLPAHRGEVSVTALLSITIMALRLLNQRKRSNLKGISEPSFSSHS